ncbi:RHS repeat-associated core domain-containing protein [Nonomuraea sp. NPDC048916]|uniref:TreTu family toxin n=1 Tax=Nonomuraea sp. NPDC048916 TaxID=3154232 RepID=UPI00341074F3
MIERQPTAAYTTKLEYNDAGDLTKMILPGNKTTGYTVNAAAEVTTETDPLGDATTFTYDLSGRLAKATNPLGNAITADYDLAGRLTTLKNLDSAGATVKTRGYGYDAVDNLTQITSGEGRITRRTFDATNALTELIEPVSGSESITTTFGYDAAGARTRLTDGRGNATWTTYNTLGLIEALTEPATTAHPDLADRTWTHVYDVAGNETALIQPGGVRHDRQFDQLNQVTTISGSGEGIATPDKTYGYDLAGRVTSVSDQTLEYNDRGLLTRVAGPSGQNSAFAYDELGNPTQRVDVTGTTAYTWDNDNRLKTVTDPVSGRINTYGYDKADRLTSVASTNPVNTQAYTYDALDRTATHTLKNSTGGQLAKITYGWDKDDNLTSKTTAGTAGAGTNTYGYDHAGRLISWTGPDGVTTAYAWDASGNRTQAGNKTYTYDQRNRLTSGDGSDYTYTPRGTLATETKNGNTKHLTFDAFDRLINDGDAVYTYDAFDRVATRQGQSAQQRFVYAGLDNDIVTITDQAGTIQAKYGRDPFGGLLSIQEGTDPALGALTDLHDDVIGTFSGTALASSTAYNPYGEVLAQTGTKPSLGYQSEFTDPDTGTVNMHARWYQPGTGTFTSRDTWTLTPNPSVQANRYTYANGGPLTGMDPTGHYVDQGGGSGDPRKIAKPPARAVNLKKPVQTVPRKGVGPLKGNVVIFAIGLAQDPRVDLSKGTKTLEAESPIRRKTGSKGLSGDDYREPRPAICKSKCGPKPPTICKSKCGPKPPTKCKSKSKCDPKPPKKKEEVENTDGCQKKCAPTCEDIGCRQECEPGQPCAHPDQIFIDDSQVMNFYDYGVDPDDYPIIHCDDSKYGTGTCSDGVAAVDPDDTDTGSFDGDPGVPIFTCEPPGNSFVPGTKVLMADGTSKPIEEVKIGGEVLATDPTTSRTEPRPVTALIAGQGTKRLVKLTIDIDGDRGDATGSITATHNHPFWVPALRLWMPAAQLQPGMWLQTSAGTHVQVTAIQKWTATQRVHNLTIDEHHTYHVLAGDQAILVHNDGDDDLVRVGRWMSQAEYDAMSRTGMVQRGGGGFTYVVHPADPKAYISARPGSVYAEFDVPRSLLIPGGRSGDYKLSDSTTINARLAEKRGLPKPELPEARNLGLGGSC